MTFQEFVSGPVAQQRYWARSHLGWARMGAAAPNPGHHALGAHRPRAAHHPERRRPARGRRVTTPRRAARPGRGRDLPGLSPYVAARRRCRSGSTTLNAGWMAGTDTRRCDPTVTSSVDATADFVVAACQDCGGVLKPDVVFFGENVPAERVARCYDAVDALGERRCAARRRLVPDGDERAAVRQARREAGHAGGDRQPRRRRAATTWRPTSSRSGPASSWPSWDQRRRTKM